MDLKHIFHNSSFGLTVQRRGDEDRKYRIVPYVELRVNEEMFEELKFELLQIGVVCTYHRKRLHIQGIQNCLLISDIIQDKWFTECMSIYKEKRHLTKDGILELLALRESHKRPNILRTPKAEVMANINNI